MRKIMKINVRIFFISLTYVCPLCSSYYVSFEFRSYHSTTNQLERVPTTIHQRLEKNQFCSGAFLEVPQDFDRMWHKGLTAKIALISSSNT